MTSRCLVSISSVFLRVSSWLSWQRINPIVARCNNKKPHSDAPAGTRTEADTVPGAGVDHSSKPSAKLDVDEMVHLDDRDSSAQLFDWQQIQSSHYSKSNSKHFTEFGRELEEIRTRRSNHPFAPANDVAHSVPISPLLRLLFRLFFRSLVGTGIFFLLLAGAKICQPILLNRIVNFLSESEVRDDLPPDISRSDSPALVEGLLYAFALTVSALAQTTLHHRAFFEVTRLGQNIRTTISMALYHHCLSLPAYSAAHTSSGSVLNLVSNECARLDEACMYAHCVWSVPLELAVVSYFLVSEIGFFGLIGLGCLLLLLVPVQLVSARFVTYYRKLSLLHTEQRTKLMQEMVAGVEVIKMRCMEEMMEQRLMAMRRQELNLIRKAARLKWIQQTLYFVFTPFLGCTMFLSMYLWNTTRSDPGDLVALTPRTAFTVMSFLAIMRNPVCKYVPWGVERASEARIAVEKLMQFFLLPTKRQLSLPQVNEERNGVAAHAVEALPPYAFELINATFTWQCLSAAQVSTVSPIESDPIQPSPLLSVIGDARSLIQPELQVSDFSSHSSSPSTFEIDHAIVGFSPLLTEGLHRLNARLPRDALICVIGPTGAYKSSLLLALIGEMHLIDGSLHCSLPASRVSYASQQSWLQSDTIRNNILAHRPFDEPRYQRVLELCELQEDLTNASEGDQTRLSANASNLSGGQCARVALARAVYNYVEDEAFLLDDPLAALDPLVARRIADHVIAGKDALLAGKTRIVVTAFRYLMTHADVLVEMRHENPRLLLHTKGSESASEAIRRYTGEGHNEEDQEEESRDEIAVDQVSDLPSNARSDRRARVASNTKFWTETDLNQMQVQRNRRLSSVSHARSGDSALPAALDSMISTRHRGLTLGRDPQLMSGGSVRFAFSVPAGQDSIESVIGESEPEYQFMAVGQISAPSRIRAGTVGSHLIVTTETNAGTGAGGAVITSDEAEFELDAEVTRRYTMLAEMQQRKRTIAVTTDLEHRSSTSTDRLRDDSTSLPPTPTAILKLEARSARSMWTLLLDLLRGEPGVSYLPVIGMVFLMLSAQASVLGGDRWLVEWANHWTLSEEDPSLSRSHPQSTYAWIFLAFGLLSLFLSLFRSSFTFHLLLGSSGRFHRSLVHSILFSPMSFFESTSSGDIMNRCTKDQSIMDEILPLTIFDCWQSIGTVIGCVIAIAWLSPFLLLLLLPLTPLTFYFQRRGGSCNRAVKSLEGVARSPVYDCILSSFDGLPLIRCLDLGSTLMQQFSERIDRHSRVLLTLNYCNRWVGLRLDLVAVSITSAASFLAVSLPDSIPSSSAAFTLSYSLLLSQVFSWTVRQVVEVQTSMSAVERIDEFLQMPIEEESSEQVVRGQLLQTEGRIGAPPVAIEVESAWPSHGAIQLNQLLFYKGQFCILRGVTATIQGGERIGLCGRTGSGKSSLLEAVQRLAFISSASQSGDAVAPLVIDGLDCSRIPLHRLRSAMTVLPQIPLLFSGTLRENLDPNHRYSDAQLHDCLARVELGYMVDGGPNALCAGLDTVMCELGSNLSLGECQLVSFARALLESQEKKIVLIDEATASLDARTEKIIHGLIRREFRGCTMLMVAHRLHSIMHSDKIMVMEKGNIVAFEPPNALVDPENPSVGAQIFREMWRNQQLGH